MELSEDDYKLLCSQQHNIPPPLHLVKTSWPIMTIRQKFMVVCYISSVIGICLLFIFGGPLWWFINH